MASILTGSRGGSISKDQDLFRKRDLAAVQNHNIEKGNIYQDTKRYHNTTEE